MQIDRLLYPVHSLGPGDRLAIWIRGCKKRCFNCANPELQLFNPNSEVSMTVIKEMISKIDKKIDGITITGGEPFCQAKDLFEIITFMLEITDDILIFTGYSKKEIYDLNNDYAIKCIEKATVVIYGEYVDELNDNHTPLIASSNQVIEFYNPKINNKYINYMNNGRIIENFYYNDNLISVGIHNSRRKKGENTKVDKRN
ncbi:MAG: 4Fe-4S cluster-binding domain-containing protein [Eubacterium sp.]|jgi:anaerobic ribonucleoside-triphosphate reductase activating protein|nr:4Fe-4S cluster-binding domain-containing protein [Eubacterium sp.]